MIVREYKTKQRQIILETLKKNKNKHLSVEEIYDLLEKKGDKIGKATIYRNLNKLIEEGKIKKYSKGNKSSAYFQFLNDNMECCNHIHLKCMSCGKLFHLECKEMLEFQKHITEEHEFTINKTETVIYGLCKHCR